MMLAAVVLAAGRGRRLAPLTSLRPKPLCPIGDSTGLDLALDRLATMGFAGPDTVAVNAHHLAEAITAAVADRAHTSVERPRLLGTAGAIGALRDWIGGRAVVVCNGDAYLVGDALGVLLEGWNGARPRLLTVHDPSRGDFGDRRFAGVSLLPSHVAASIPVRPASLVTVWKDAELVDFDGTFIDCGTPRDYLTANLHASGGVSVVGRGAIVRGRLTRSVVWPGAVVGPEEDLVDAIRTDTGLTVQVGTARADSMPRLPANSMTIPDNGSSAP